MAISYEYGQLDQLAKETLKDGTVLEYTYDGFGNRTLVKKIQNGQTTSTVSEYNIANQLTKFGSEIIKYDLNGNRTEDGKFIYKWNVQDQLESVTKKGETSPFVIYKYDEDGRRIQKSLGTSVTNYHYDGDSLNVIYETDGQNQVVRSYIYSESGQLLAMKKGTEKYFYHYNAHRDVSALTDKSGNVVATYEYDAWGNVLKSEETAAVKDNPYRYAGYQFDHEIGMYYLIARYYQPTHGVFLSLDPDPGDEDDILTQNGYTYANNNPVKFIVPDGHFVWLAINAGFAAYDGYKAYKTGKGWKYVAKKAALGAIGGGEFKLVRNGVKHVKYVKLLGNNARKHKSRVNTDLPGGKAVAKSIFRHYSKGKKVTQKTNGPVTRRTTSNGKYQIRYTKLKNGKTKVNLDFKRGGIYEDIHFLKGDLLWIQYHII